MGWIQRLFCPNGDKIASLLQENAKKTEDILKLTSDNLVLKQELNVLKSGDKPVSPEFVFDSSCVKQITTGKLRTILSEAFPGTEIKLADTTYQYTTLAELQRWNSFDPTNELKYRAEQLDCDKYALTDMANFKSENNYQLGNGVFGIAWGSVPFGYHAWNIAYADEELIMVEPQHDTLMLWKDDKTYKPDFIYI